MSLEHVVRPFETPAVTPTPFTRQNQKGSPLAHLKVAGKASDVKKASYSYSCTVTSKLVRIHKEKPDIQRALGR